MSKRQLEQLNVCYTGNTEGMQHLRNTLPLPLTLVHSHIQGPIDNPTFDSMQPLAAQLRTYLHDPAHMPTERDMVRDMTRGHWLLAYDEVAFSRSASLPPYPRAFAHITTLQNSAGLVFRELGVTSGKDVRDPEGWMDQGDPLRHFAGAAAILEWTAQRMRPKARVYIAGNWNETQDRREEWNETVDEQRDRREGWFFKMCNFEQTAAPQGEVPANETTTYLAASALVVREALAKHFTFSLPPRSGIKLLTAIKR